MSSVGPIFISKANLSEAWAEAFSTLTRPGVEDILPLVVNISGSNGGPPEQQAVRDLLDAALATNAKCCRCDTTANTIFPRNLWLRHQGVGRGAFFTRYLDHVLPRLKKADSRNRRGTYFERLISYGGKNQIEHILAIWSGGNHRRSALQAMVFDPSRDHSNQPRMGFPCLDHVTLTHDHEGGLSVTALYATQFVFDRAYGNYLGLCRLGEFMAGQMGLTFRQLTCIAGFATVGSLSKTEATKLNTKIQAALNSAKSSVGNATVSTVVANR